jgi:hypothetical protein
VLSIFYVFSCSICILAALATLRSASLKTSFHDFLDRAESTFLNDPRLVWHLLAIAIVLLIGGLLLKAQDRKERKEN